ncbi:MAG: hypothetical protein FWE58_04660 [Methanobrevibacter sp.]|nr:hypothetical protein [Methanobrevibacter sp.]
MSSQRVRTTLNIEKNLMKAIKLTAINEEKTQTEIINETLKKEFIDVQKPNNEVRQPLSEMAGIFKAKKPFNSVKLIKKIEHGDDN